MQLFNNDYHHIITCCSRNILVWFYVWFHMANSHPPPALVEGSISSEVDNRLLSGLVSIDPRTLDMSKGQPVASSGSVLRRYYYGKRMDKS